MLTNTTNVDRYLINGTPLSTYAIHFPYWDKEEINVYLTNSDGSLSTLTEGTNYTLSTPNGTNGTLTRVGDWTAGATNLTIIREMSLTQEVDLRNGDKIDAETLETALDNLTAQVQQLAETQSRAVVSSVDEAGSNLAIPNKASRIGSGSGTMMGFGSDGESIVLRDLAQFDADVASAASDASSASASAGTATTQALKSEGYAVGEQNGSPVTSGSPYYENNSKHYAQVAKAGADVITDNITAITNLDTNMTDINAVADDISNVVAVAGDLTKVDAVADDLTNIDAVNANKTNIDTVAGIALDVTNVAGVASDIPTVAGVSTDISTVATDISDVSAVAGDLAKVKAVADDLTNIDAVNANKTNIDTVAGKASEITTVAGKANDVTTVAGIASNVTTVAGKASEVTTVAGIASDVSAVAQVASDVASVADELTDIGTVASNISDVAAVGADIAKVSAVADDLTSIDAVYADLANIDAADDHALEAEGWAAGTQNGVPVSSGSPYYENNAKYWADAVPDLKDALTADENIIFGERTINLFNTGDPDIIENGYLNINGELVENTDLFEAGFISTTPSTTFTMYANNAYLTSSRTVCYYDSNKIFISGVNESMPTITPPNNATFFRCLFRNTERTTLMIVKNDSTIHPYVPYYTENGFIPTTEKRLENLEQATPNNWAGLNGVAFGTSITYRSQTTGGYLQFLPSMSGITFDNQGVGSSYIYGSSGSLNMLEKIKGYAGFASKNIVTIEGFVNDWYNSHVLGEYTDSEETSVCGCVRSAINYIRSQNANATVFMILDHYGQNASGADCSSTAKRNNITQYEYYEEIAKVGKSLGIHVLKLYEESEMSESTPQYYIDNIHPNALGAKQTANIIWALIRMFYPNAVQ